MGLIGLPQIDIQFKQLAASSVNRSTKGVVAIIIKDDTNKTFSQKTYTDVTALIKDKALYAQANYDSLMDCFLGSPSKVIVIRIDLAGLIGDALIIANGLSFNYLTAVSSVVADHNTLVIWVKAQNLVRNKPIKAATYKATTTDDMHIINFYNDTVKRKADEESVAGHFYLGRIAGLLAGLSFKRSATYYSLTDLDRVSEVANVTTAINGGQFVIINDEGEPKIARAVNSLQTLTSGVTDDMKYIAIVEAMDLISEDIKSTFKTTFIGKFKNNLSNQILFISAVNGYFKELAAEEILDNEFENIAMIDTNQMRIVWAAKGKDVSALSDSKVAKLTIGAELYAAAVIKILNAIEGLSFPISMN